MNIESNSPNSNECSISQPHLNLNGDIEDNIEIEHGNSALSPFQVEIASNFNSNNFNNFNEEDQLGPGNTGNDIERNPNNLRPNDGDLTPNSRALRFKRALEQIQMTEEEMATEGIRIIFNSLFDLAGVAAAVFVGIVFQKQDINPILFGWFMIYGVLSLISCPLQVLVSVKIFKRTFTRSLKQKANIVDSILLPICVAGYIINYSIDHGSQMKKATANIILASLIVLSVRLLKIVMIGFLKFLWQPLINLIDNIGKEQPVQAQKKILEKISTINFETYMKMTSMKVDKQKEVEQIDADLETNAQSDNLTDINKISSNQNSNNIDQDVKPVLDLQSQQCNNQKLAEIEKLCSICLIDFDQESEITPMPCKNHYYHKECITQWLKKNCICPVCRHKVNISNLTELNKSIKC